MAKAKPSDIVGKIVDLLTPLTSEERGRVISAARTLLGEVATADSSRENDQDANAEENTTFSTSGKAKSWQKQNGVTPDQLAQVFHVADGKAEIIVGEMPGKNKKEKTLNAYVFAGIGQLLAIGEPKFTDKESACSVHIGRLL